MKPTRWTQDMIDYYTKKGIWTSETWSDIYEKNARLYPDDEALVSYAGLRRKAVTWAEMNLAIDRLALGLLELAEPGGVVDDFGAELHLGNLGACLDDLRERLLLMGRISLDNLHEVGNEVVPLLKDGINGGKNVVYLVLLSDQRVVYADEYDGYDRNNYEKRHYPSSC